MKTRTTLALDVDLLRAVRAQAARTGKPDSQIIEEALRRDLGLEVVERLWNRNHLDEQDAADLAIEAQHETRSESRD